MRPTALLPPRHPPSLPQVASLRADLKPYILRRVKADVFDNFPTKVCLSRTAPHPSHTVLLSVPIATRSLLLSAPSHSVRTGGGACARGHEPSAAGLLPRADGKEYRAVQEQGALSVTSVYALFPACILSPNANSMTRAPRASVLLGRSAHACGQKQLPLVNMVMQLKKCANHPYLFEGAEPVGLGSHGEAAQRMIEASGKLQLVMRMLPRLRDQGHRVLIFSQVRSFGVDLSWANDGSGGRRGSVVGKRWEWRSAWLTLVPTAFFP
jgi:hypothetical protein